MKVKPFVLAVVALLAAAMGVLPTARGDAPLGTLTSTTGVALVPGTLPSQPNVAFLDSGAVEIYTPQNTLLTQFGVAESLGLASDAAGNIYVGGLVAVSKYTSSGTLLANINMPLGGGRVAVTPDGRIYTAGVCTVSLHDPSLMPTLVASWGTCGSGPGQFSSVDTLMYVAVAPNGDVLVTDQGNRRVQRFTATGTYISEFGSAGTGPGQFNFGPAQPGMPIAVDAAGAIYVMDLTRLQKFTPAGAYVGEWAIGGQLGGMAVNDAGGQLFAASSNKGYWLTSLTPPPLGTPAPGSPPVGPPGGVSPTPGTTFGQVGPPPGGGVISVAEGTEIEAGIPVELFVRVAQGSMTRVEWDVMYDDQYEGASTAIEENGQLARFTGVFVQAGRQSVHVRVTMNDGTKYQWFTSFDVLEPQVGVTINDGAQYTNDPAVKVTLIGPLGVRRALVSNDGGFSPGTTFSFPTSTTTVRKDVSWRIQSSGAERLPKTVYVRYSGQPGGAQNVQDDIILDQTAPVVTSAALIGTGAAGASLTATSAPLVASALRRYSVRLRAKDNVSGVRFVQVTADRKRPGKWLGFAAKKSVTLAARPRWVRVRDRAGNASAWKRIP